MSESNSLVYFVSCFPDLLSVYLGYSDLLRLTWVSTIFRDVFNGIQAVCIKSFRSKYLLPIVFQRQLKLKYLTIHDFSREEFQCLVSNISSLQLHTIELINGTIDGFLGNSDCNEMVRELILDSVSGCSDSMSEFIQIFVGLKKLSIRHCADLTDKSITRSVSRMQNLSIIELKKLPLILTPILFTPSLRFIDLSCCNSLTKVYPVIGRAKCLNIVNINLSSTSIDIAAVELIIKHSPNLRTLTARSCIRCVGHLNVCSLTIECLDLSGSKYISILTVKCPKLASLLVANLPHLIFLAASSRLLNSLDLTLLKCLAFVHLDCPHLVFLRLYGCESLGKRSFVLSAALAEVDAPTAYAVQHCVDSELPQILLDHLLKTCPHLSWWSASDGGHLSCLAGSNLSSFAPATHS